MKRNQDYIEKIKKVNNAFIIERHEKYALLISRSNNNKQIAVFKDGNTILIKTKKRWHNANITYSGSGEYPTLNFPGLDDSCKIHMLKVILFKLDDLLEIIEAGEEVNVHHLDCNKDNYDLNNLAVITYNVHLAKHNKKARK